LVCWHLTGLSQPRAASPSRMFFVGFLIYEFLKIRGPFDHQAGDKALMGMIGIWVYPVGRQHDASPKPTSNGVTRLPQKNLLLNASCRCWATFNSVVNSGSFRNSFNSGSVVK
jgi:hypothetical protein